MYRVIVSLTTSPSRLLLLEPVIQSILRQDYPISHIEINLPEKYKNKEEYIIPDFLKKYERVKIFRIEKDIGPATKIIPTILRYREDFSSPETFIISLDDDHYYPSQIATTLLKGLALYGDKNIYTIGGINMYVGANNTLTSINVYKTAPVDVLEGVFGVLYNPRLFESDILDYINKVIECKECLTSDDITISNYLAWKKIKIIRLNLKSFNKLILYKKILFRNLTIKESEKDGNAIHLMSGGHKRRYFDACLYLKNNDMLYLKIK
jgi:hypothetical protein